MDLIIDFILNNKTAQYLILFFLIWNYKGEILAFFIETLYVSIKKLSITIFAISKEVKNAIKEESNTKNEQKNIEEK